MNHLVDIFYIKHRQKSNSVAPFTDTRGIHLNLKVILNFGEITLAEAKCCFFLASMLKPTQFFLNNLLVTVVIWKMKNYFELSIFCHFKIRTNCWTRRTGWSHKAQDKFSYGNFFSSCSRIRRIRISSSGKVGVVLVDCVEFFSFSFFVLPFFKHENDFIFILFSRYRWWIQVDRSRWSCSKMGNQKE